MTPASHSEGDDRSRNQSRGGGLGLPIRWTHRWQISLGTTVVNRLYPRALGVGVPDFIESAMPIVPNGEDFFADLVPSCVFTGPPERDTKQEEDEARAEAIRLLLEKAARSRQ